MELKVVAKEKLKVGLALGGGGARGLAHIGVLKVLKRENIPIDLIVGTSMGAIIGAAYALKKDISTLEKIAEKYSKIGEFNINLSFSEKEKEDKPYFIKKMSDFLKKGYILNLELRRKYLNDGEGLKKIINDLVGDKVFADTKIPFAAVAADLIKGEKVILNQGKLFNALLASASIPGIFPPIILEGKILVDGGIVDVVPIEAARSLGANFIIAVNVSPTLKKRFEFSNAVEILFRSDSITSNELIKLQLSFADLVITPKVERFHWSNFSKPEKCIREGEIAAQNVLSELKKKLKRVTPSWWKRLFY
ncbi:MAG: patatin [Candidatus Infernicultor aquiphilus]|uniref:Patatin n=1 Tax=Candidatus Infernicultor aquiphilus TaxID=1805029 RepID=A0A2M7PRK7_9BACT|nr:MAG: patatin [Candidatus Atribacteria bacterium CG_4_8_14_3_um_filter_34_18]PIY33250.1 MAG: patatin [Candidatus Atribacteria bacterium CG_4_10_14_3_um_filter_34_13]PJB55736.1 MAG: patatin [Candidatus Atribacteria bacterium CG_4_9_14_3_um_filter_33_16]